MEDKLLKLQNLKTFFFMQAGVVRAVDGIDIEIDKGDFLGIVGESGCGKSVTALSIMRLITNPPGKIIDGEIIFRGNDLLQLTNEEMRKIRGNKISMIFQEPMTSLSPVSRIGSQISEAMIIHQNLSKKEALERSIELLKLVEIPSPEVRVKEYPHQMSGGMRQRVMIAMALSCNPELIIADEPTTALDVTIQAQILALMQTLKEEKGLTIILITHNLGIIAENSNRVIVMYAGKIVEKADVKALFVNPLHPYTRGLLRSVPRMDKRSKKKDRLDAIRGIVPSLLNLAPGCRFYERCDLSAKKCQEVEPELVVVDGGHMVSCWNYG
jgi:peptide/nickel transport system ATP-binding protein/oligopeptide transport system ATP-binding protein